MCGLCGEITFDGSSASVEALTDMTRVLVPRGPDAQGLLARGPMAFGHRRLKIIDLSEKAQQPMVDPDLGLTLAFNGCIYNHKALASATVFSPMAIPRLFSRLGMPGALTRRSGSTACSLS